MDRAKIMGINEYTFLRTLGKGAFAEVKLGTKSKLENETDVVRDLDVNNFERCVCVVLVVLTQLMLSVVGFSSLNA